MNGVAEAVARHLALVEDAHTWHFNRGEFEHRKPLFDDPDDLFDALRSSAAAIAAYQAAAPAGDGERYRETVREVAERLSIEGQLNAPCLSKEARLRATMDRLARDLFASLTPKAAASDKGE